MISQKDSAESIQRPAADTKKYLLITIGVMTAVILVATLIGSLFVYGRIKAIRDLRVADEAAYSEGMRKCGGKPYMFIDKNDPIEGVNLDSSYYEPTHPNYANARQGAINESVGFLAFDYRITYECDATKAGKLNIERGI